MMVHHTERLSPAVAEVKATTIAAKIQKYHGTHWRSRYSTFGAAGGGAVISDTTQHSSPLQVQNEPARAGRIG